MKLKKYKPTSPGLRHKLFIQKNLLSFNNNIVKSLVYGKKRSVGRSSQTGRITVWHKGGGVKRKLRKFSNASDKGAFITVGVFYDPNRNSFISLNFDVFKKSFEFSITPFFTFAGNCSVSNNKLDELNLGSRSSISSIPAGAIVHNVGKNHKNIGLFGRSAGTFCQIIQKGLKTAKIKLPSNKVIEVSKDYFATLGCVANLEHSSSIKSKAGFSRLKGKRPTTRGIAMNPVDHPHGGRTNGGRPCVTPWGKPTKGKPTSKKQKRY